MAAPSFNGGTMKKFYVFLVTALVAVTFVSPQSFGAAGLPSLSTVRTLLNQGVPNGFVSQLGIQVVDHKVQLVKAKYRHSLHGGASVVAPTTLLAYLDDEDGKDAVLPKNAVIKQVMIDAVTTPTASAVAGFTAPFLMIGINNSQDLLAPTAVASLSGRVAGIPIGTAATMVKTVASSALTIGLQGGSVTAGELNVFVEYYLSD